MAERFTTLTRSDCRLYTEGSPVVLSAYALLKDNNNDAVITQLKLTNVSTKQISGVFVKVNAFDLSGAAVQGVEEYQYLDMNATWGESFGQKKAIPMPCNVTRKVEIRVLRVVFADGTAWIPGEDAVWEPVPVQETVSGHFRNAELVRQYGMAVGSSRCDYMPKQYKGLTLCTCGAISVGDERTCHGCRRSFAVLFAVDEEKLATDCAARLAKEKAEREAAEQAKREAAEKARAEAEATAKKTKKILSVAVPAALVAILAFMLVTKVFIPNSRYNAALALKNAGQYEEAIAAFEAMDGYKDSETQIIACRTAIKDIAYNEALALMDAGRYEEAIVAFYEMGGYKDSREKIEACKTAIKDIAYNEALALKDAGEYEAAIVAFGELDGYMDSRKQIQECNYLRGLVLMDAGQYKEAIAVFVALNRYKDSNSQLVQCYKARYGEPLWEQYVAMLDAGTGRIITFGSYEQDNDLENGGEAIEWKVLKREENRLLVISRYALDCKPYNTEAADVTWESCTLRSWLNGEFFDTAFGTAEQGLIQDSLITVTNSSRYSTDPGETTTDKVFLLSHSEVDKYFGVTKKINYTRLQCTPTNYAQAQGAPRHEGATLWWLRDSAPDKNRALDVGYYGDVYDIGSRVDTSYIAVRPAMWIDLDA